MADRRVAVVAILLASMLVLSSGCVSKKLFRRNVADSDARVNSVESAVEANERRITDLRQETDSKLAAVEGNAERAVEVGQSALSMAQRADETAQQAALGRLLWDVTLSDERVKFTFGQAAIPAAAAEILDDLVDQVKSYGKAVYLEIEGHTDNTGSAEYNMILGERRAEAVRAYLGRQGIPLHAMNTISYGETSPVADNGNAAGRSQNRRVVVRVLE